MQPVQSAIAQGHASDIAASALFGGPTTTGNALLAFVSAYRDSARQLSDTYDNSWTRLLTVLANGVAPLEVWCANVINGGAGHQVTVGAAANCYPAICPIELIGENQQSLIDAVVSLSDNSAAPSTPVCQSAAGELILTALTHNFNGSPTIAADGGFSPLQIAANASGLQPLAVAWQQSDVGVPGAWQVGQAVPWACIALSLKPLPGPVPSPVKVIARRKDMLSGPALSSGVSLFPMPCDVTFEVDLDPSIVVSPRAYQLILQPMLQSQPGGDYRPFSTPVEWTSGPGASAPSFVVPAIRGSKVRLEIDPKNPLPAGCSITVAPH